MSMQDLVAKCYLHVNINSGVSSNIYTQQKSSAHLCFRVNEYLH